jgi:dolichol-phosphate mannosyltransferase
MPVEVSVILPTINERSCLEVVGPRLEAALEGLECEFIVVDDESSDGTPEWCEERAASNPSWKVLRRVNAKGLASAVIDGFAVARGKYFVVMDADGSHPPEQVSRLVCPIADGRAEFVLASRGGIFGTGNGLSLGRKIVSVAGSLLARPLTPVTDPMSGFFAIHPRILRRAVLSPLGFKIGLEVIVKCHPSPIVEVEYTFGSRIAGKSKLSSHQVFEFLRHLSRLYGHQTSAPWDTR